MTWRTAARTLAPVLRQGFGDALLPQRCIVCGRYGAALHDACLDALPHADPPRCPRCWLPTAGSAREARRRDGACSRCAAAPPPFEGLRTPYRFVGAARRAVIEAKFRGVSALLDPLGRASARVVPGWWSVDAVTPVPLHGARRRRRGFDQARLLAATVADELGVPLTDGLLRRVRATGAQTALGMDRRRRNMAGAFEVRAAPPPSVLLVDDVATTGATLGAAARALLDAGADRVYALAIARED
ncbi:MAG: ComF family protein [Chloroflexi bacterium]|nr:ComF family protein [Chloroflexota bacterium]